MIDEKITTEYPVRYEAFAVPRVLFIAQDTALETTKNRELAVYHEPMQNKEYPYLEDGVYAEIRNFHGQEYLTELHATQPWKGRAQKNMHKMFSDFAHALAWMEEQIPIFQSFCTQEMIS